MQRVILHCDMNNFYASVECMLNPELKNKPVAVCGSVEERHGIVLAKNYAAKAFGVSTGEAIWQAKQKCQDLVIVEPHYEQYIKFSKLAREIYGRYTDQIEPYGMDECWLDVTGSGCMGTGFEIADEIRRTVKFELGLTISAGVSFNKIFAKLGSDMKKPDAITCIEADSFREKIWCLPAADLLGVGRATEKVLSGYGIHTIGELAATSDDFLKCRLGKNGQKIKHVVKPKLGEHQPNNPKLVYTMDFQVTPHQLRHTYITNLIYASVDPKTVQYLAGHENSKVTMDIYAKVKYNKPAQLHGVINRAIDTSKKD